MNRFEKIIYTLTIAATLFIATACSKDEPKKDGPDNPTPDYVDKDMKDPNVPIPEL